MILCGGCYCWLRLRGRADSWDSGDSVEGELGGVVGNVDVEEVARPNCRFSSIEKG